ncbi:helix-loop-helix DNA-binding domain-containing protein [Colletotrichum cuscutae]|uniref:Helix-loop-helix DNA-binding domain-containing protein n=1 Tax=Colletotrichum cuscutae TaxID=1209917 RepID=A0AAI9Y1P8_9PEZI|nr:helix-loop-helix DNA-binding domain-containing protein [Colletotrichum cuscutae]
MADVMSEHPDLSELARSPSPGQKRKRDDDLSDSMSPSRKRSSAEGLSDVDTAAFIENAVEAAHAAAQNGVSAADFSALQQAAAAEHSEAADPANASSTAAAALGSMYPTLHVPPTTEEQFAAQSSSDPTHGQDHGFGHADLSPPDGLPGLPPVPQPTNGLQSVQPQQSHQPHQHQQPPPPQHRYSSGSAGTPAKKPDVGSEEWHKMRKDNHKEVERRRRETINEGINELAKIVPNCEKNKGSILQRAVTFINQLKENETQNIEKWTLEKLLTEQAIAELSASNDKLKQECERLYKELETWKRVAQNAAQDQTPYTAANVEVASSPQQAHIDMANLQRESQQDQHSALLYGPSALFVDEVSDEHEPPQHQLDTPQYHSPIPSIDCAIHQLDIPQRQASASFDPLRQPRSIAPQVISPHTTPPSAIAPPIPPRRFHSPQSSGFAASIPQGVCQIENLDSDPSFYFSPYTPSQQ